MTRPPSIIRRLRLNPSLYGRRVPTPSTFSIFDPDKDGEKMRQEKKIIDATDVLIDSDNEKIILGTYGRARSAIEISQIYGIPIAICFKKVRKLNEMGLLEATEVRYTPRGEIVYYQASIQDAYVFYDSGRLKVRFEVVLRMASGIRKRLESSEFSSTMENIEADIHV